MTHGSLVSLFIKGFIIWIYSYLKAISTFMLQIDAMWSTNVNDHVRRCIPWIRFGWEYILAEANNGFIRAVQGEERGISWPMLVSILMVCINGWRGIQLWPLLDIIFNWKWLANAGSKKSKQCYFRDKIYHEGRVKTLWRNICIV